MDSASRLLRPNLFMDAAVAYVATSMVKTLLTLLPQRSAS
jgi:hypothetical protein